MRKRILEQTPPDAPPVGQDWMDAGEIEEVEVTSEDADFPVESALRGGAGPGWRAARAGPQLIRLHFPRPGRLRRIRLVFEEHQVARTQEFVLRWTANGHEYREVVRQQFNFSPPGTIREVEDYTVDLPEVSALELSIVPDVDGREHPASLREWRLA